MKFLSVFFLAFIALVIFAADTGAIPPYITSLYRFPGGDWAGHFILYGILAFLFARAFPRRLGLGGFHPALTSLLAAGLALAEEFSQFFFPLRTPSLPDLVCGLAGILLADWLATGRGKKPG